MIIKEKTVLILGAGASEPFKYPIGTELKQIICNEIKALDIARLLSSEDDEVTDFEQDIIKFQADFQKSSQNSIDIFLKINPELRDIGKLCIASALFTKEREELLKRNEERNWYIRFWNMIDNAFENIDRHNLHFVTFNYDRSLEHFLVTSLYHSYCSKKTEEECAAKINSLDLIHVYGCLSPLPWQSTTGSRPYSASRISKRDVDNVMNNLYIIGEERINRTQRDKLDEVKRILYEAKFIYFLGFGYDEENLNILGDNWKNAELIWGTTKGLGKVGERKTEMILQSKTNFRNQASIQNISLDRIQLFNCDVATFLKEHIFLL